MDYKPPGSSAHGILQIRIWNWVAMPFSRGSFQPRDQTQVSSIAGGFFTLWATREALLPILGEEKKAGLWSLEKAYRVLP